MRQRSALILALLSACGSPAPECKPFQACGGNPVGSWHLAATCNQAVTSACGRYLEVAQDFRGTLVLGDDATYLLDATVSAAGRSTVPAACLPGARDCSSLDGMYATCSGDPATACTCTYQEPRGNASEIGTWSQAGSSIAFTPMGDAAYGGTYCVSGDQLQLSLHNDLGAFVLLLTR